MRKRRSKILLGLLPGRLGLTLAACAAGETPAPTPAAETAAPSLYEAEATPSPYDTVEEIVLQGDESREELFDLPRYTRLRRLDARAYPCTEVLLELWEAMAGANPDCEVEWTVPLCGEEHSSLCTELDFSEREEGQKLEDNSEWMEMLRYFPRLERVNLLESGLRHKDVAPLAELTELEYLELFLNGEIEDFSPLNALTKMVDINLSYCKGLRSLEFMEHMPHLKRCWLRLSGLERDTVTAAEERYPEVEVMFASRSISATCGTWRAEERNIAIRTAFARWKDVVEFRDWEHVVYREGAVILPAKSEIT